MRALKLATGAPAVGQVEGEGPDDLAMIFVTSEPVYLYLGPSPAAEQFAPVRAYYAVYPPRDGTAQGERFVVYGHLPQDWAPPD